MTNSSSDDYFVFDPEEIDNLWKNINKSPSDSFLSWISWATLTFALLGSISNFMSVIVLMKLGRQLSTFVYLTSLSLSDMITCLTVMILQLIEIFLKTRRSVLTSVIFRHVEILIGALAAGSRVLSLWVSLAVTIDRWILICYPLYGKRLCRIKRAKYICRTLTFLAFIYLIPLIFEYEVIKVDGFDQSNKNNLTPILTKKSFLIARGYSDLAKRRLFRWSYLSFNILFVYLLPTITILILNIRLIRALSRLKSRQRQTKHVNSSSRKSSWYRFYHSKYSVTLMVISIVSTLIICRSPTIVIWILWSFEFTIKIFFDSSFSHVVRGFQSLANLIATINAAINFIPFCIFGQLFRDQCLKIYCCHQTRKNPKRIIQKNHENYQEKYFHVKIHSNLSSIKDINDVELNQNQLINSEKTNIHSKTLISLPSTLSNEIMIQSSKQSIHEFQSINHFENLNPSLYVNNHQ